MENVMEQPPTVVGDETLDVGDDGTEYPDGIVGEITDGEGHGTTDVGEGHGTTDGTNLRWRM
jgi:hypothetical protein